MKYGAAIIFSIIMLSGCQGIALTNFLAPYQGTWVFNGSDYADEDDSEYVSLSYLARRSKAELTFEGHTLYTWVREYDAEGVLTIETKTWYSITEFFTTSILLYEEDRFVTTRLYGSIRVSSDDTTPLARVAVIDNNTIEVGIPELPELNYVRKQ